MRTREERAAPAAGFRVFIAGPRETLVVEAPPGVEEAYDLMTADGVPPQQAADMAMAASRAGKDPVAFARHFTRLRRVHRAAQDGR